jgi:hypothetical protein
MVKHEHSICKCQRCGLKWKARHPPEKVRACPKCKSYYWREPRKENVQ